MNITVLTTATGALSDFAAGFKRFSKAYPDTFKLNLFESKGNITDKRRANMEEAFRKTDFIILDLRLATQEWIDFSEELLKQKPEHAECFLFNFPDKQLGSFFKFGKLDEKHLAMTLHKAGVPPMLFAFADKGLMKKILDVVEDDYRADYEALISCVEFWIYANREHMEQLLLVIARHTYVSDMYDFPEPVRPLVTKHPLIHDRVKNEAYEELDKYARDMSFDNEKPTVAVLYLGYNFRVSQVEPVWGIIEKMRSFANVVPVFIPGVSSIDTEKLEKLLKFGGYKVDAIMNFAPFRLGAGPAGGNSEEIIELLEALKVPLLHPFVMNKSTKEEWEESNQGLDSSEYLLSIMLPELDGATDPIPVAAVEKGVPEDCYDFEENKLVLIDDRVEQLLARLEKLLSLQGKRNAEKKVAVIGYNYPPGEDSVFHASLIDTFASVENILHILKDDGYTVPDVTKEELMDTFSAGKLLNAGKWDSDDVYEGMGRYDVKDYVRFMKEDNKALYDDLVDHIGQPPGVTMVDDDAFLIPGKSYGNVFVGVQPSRTGEEDIVDAYHDTSQYPHHQYMAFYSWLKDVFEADVVLHVGTHGTLEFLKGKEVAMSKLGAPNNLIGDLPHLYIYYIGNPSEAMIAKRRSFATLVSYQNPPYDQSDLYEEYIELEDMFANQKEAERLDPKRAKLLLDKIFEKAKELHFAGGSLDEIEYELYRMKRSLIPSGLHIFGEGFDSDAARRFFQFCIRYDRGDVKSLRRIIAEEQELDYDKIQANNNVAQLKKLEMIEKQLIDYYFEHKKVNEQFITNPDLIAECEKTFAYGDKAYGKSMYTHEADGLLKGLRGEYIPVGLSSDVVKNPDVLPSGYNMYQFDPRQIPEKTAAENGAKISENTLKIHFDEHKKYPDSIGVVLWGFETSRTQGETIGQILHYLGARVKNAKGGFQVEYEIIPLEELGRPRVDVNVNMTGFFRDIFPNVLDQLNDLFVRIAELDETDEDNYLRAHYKQYYDLLTTEGHPEEEARSLAAARIFGPQESEYSTRVTGLVGSGNWEEESDLAQGYMRDMKYVYGPNGYRGKAADSLLKAQLKAVDIVSQIRSNHEFEVTDLDHYFEFFGGMSKAVENVRGEKVPILISDTTGEKVHTEDVKKSIERGVRTRTLNPKWIDSLMEHEVHGGQKVLEQFENLVGLAATTGSVDTWVFSAAHETYINDEKRREELRENNQWAFHSIVERLYESYQRGYWDASEEELEQLQEVYLDLEGSIEEQL